MKKVKEIGYDYVEFAGYFDKTAEEFSDIMAEIAYMGAAILGGCCGTTPEYIRKTVDKTKDITFRKTLFTLNQIN